MRRGFGQFLRIEVAADAVSVQRLHTHRIRWRGVGGTGSTAADTLATQAIAPSADQPFDAIANALRAILGELDAAGWPVTIVLADELTRMWRVTPPPGAAHMADLEAAAALRFHSLYGETSAAWQVSADWSATQPFFAAGVPRALLASLQTVTQERKLSIVAIEPRFVSAWNRSRHGLKPGAWFGHVHQQLLTLAATETDGQGLRAIRPLPIPPGAGHDWLTQTLRREALLLDVDAPLLLQVNGSVPASWTKPVSSAAHIPCGALAERRA